MSSESALFEPGSSTIMFFGGATGYFNKATNDFSLVSEAQGFLPTSWYTKGMQDTLNGKWQKAPCANYQILMI